MFTTLNLFEDDFLHNFIRSYLKIKPTPYIGYVFNLLRKLNIFTKIVPGWRPV